MRNLYTEGHTLASLSLSKRSPSWWPTASTDQLRQEFSDHRKLIKYLAGVPESDVIGAIAPYLEISNNYVAALEAEGYAYDFSMPSRKSPPAYYPHTLHYRSSLVDECVVKGCPTRSFNLWTFPMLDWIDPKTGRICGNQIDGCNVGNRADKIYKFMLFNFNRHFEANRAPFPLYLRPGWLESNYAARAEALTRFLAHLEELDSVYLVDFNSAYRYMNMPDDLRGSFGNAEWQECPGEGSLQPCTASNTIECKYADIVPSYAQRWQPPVNISFTTCAVTTCPPNYPFTGNPYGE
ncbi:PREDICTED: uncharacterized protein LOC106805543 [Priapulus caudatus]|uniref:Uncharacterized protein LOC106805543 n=1 Tax=Priapulus caudatus TaxID=37621 RepID=A0ABM1DRU7_PRICU|nr:PREDICTED: uncharacterized protein LOC106805543 [Priapulus caudatus]